MGATAKRARRWRGGMLSSCQSGPAPWMAALVALTLLTVVTIGLVDGQDGVRSPGYDALVRSSTMLQKLPEQKWVDGVQATHDSTVLLENYQRQNRVCSYKRRQWEGTHEDWEGQDGNQEGQQEDGPLLVPGHGPVPNFGAARDSCDIERREVGRHSWGNCANHTDYHDGGISGGVDAVQWRSWCLCP